MKNTFKKFMAGSALIAMLATGSVFAEEAVLISEEPAAEVQVEETENQGTPLVENFRTKFEDIEGVTMVPVRAVAEHFGFNVEWVEESQAVNLSKGAVFVTFAINENSYAFSRMMPQPLESAPVLVNGDTTYVPVSLFEDILNSLPSAISLIKIDVIKQVESLVKDMARAASQVCNLHLLYAVKP